LGAVVPQVATISTAVCAVFVQIALVAFQIATILRKFLFLGCGTGFVALFQVLSQLPAVPIDIGPVPGNIPTILPYITSILPNVPLILPDVLIRRRLGKSVGAQNQHR
jgi:hypothetical protein